MIEILVAIYISLTLVEAFPFPYPTNLPIPTSELTLFAVLVIILSLIFTHPAFGRILKGPKKAPLWQKGFLALTELGLLASIVLSSLNEKTFNPWIERFLITDYARFIWLILPIIAMMILGRRRVK